MSDFELMRRAIELARRGKGHVEPNPMVGCVIAREGRVVSEGWHRRFGGPHAEVEALRAVQGSLQDTTLFVNLEPCCHHGKTPPCTDAILKSGVRRVVIAHQDPHPQVRGGGIEQLVAAGLKIETGLCEEEATKLNAPFLKRLRCGRPWVIAKWAMTLDGKIATSTGDSQWISGDASRAIVHQLRGLMDAIIVGQRTVEFDDPLLTARPPGPRVPARVVLTSQGELSTETQLMKTAADAPVLIASVAPAEKHQGQRLQQAGCEQLVLSENANRVSVTALLAELGRRGMTNVLVEGGAEVLGSFFDEECVDEVHVFVAPRIAGGRKAVSAVAGDGCQRISESLKLGDISVNVREQDTHIHGIVMR